MSYPIKRGTASAADNLFEEMFYEDRQSPQKEWRSFAVDAMRETFLAKFNKGVLNIFVERIEEAQPRKIKINK